MKRRALSVAPRMRAGMVSTVMFFSSTWRLPWVVRLASWSLKTRPVLWSTCQRRNTLRQPSPAASRFRLGNTTNQIIRWNAKASNNLIWNQPPLVWPLSLPVHGGRLLLSHGLCSHWTDGGGVTIYGDFILNLVSKKNNWTYHKSAWKYNLHIITSLAKVEELIEKFSCKQCDFTSTSKAQMTQHKKAEHVKLVCLLCHTSEEFPDKKSLSRHNIQVHQVGWK